MPMRLNQFVFAPLCVAAVAWSLLTAHAAFAKTESYLVIDAATTQVMAEHNSEVPGHPASLTKMMTLYLLFEAVEQGKVSFDQTFVVSQWAAEQSPTKLGLSAGESVRVHDLVLGIITQSANDAAVTVAENLGGSEPAFAELMTRKARMLGMTHTYYRNASGLPDPQQITTARDLALLALALYRDFPREYGFFATEAFTFHGITHANHNRLMRSFQGMDGIKTGYVRASGFNLAASAVRNNHRLIGIVMGGSSPSQRDAEMAQLLNTAFAGETADPTMVAQAPEERSPSIVRGGDVSTAANVPPVAETPPSVRGVHQAGHELTARWGIQVGAFAQQGLAVKALAHALVALAHPHGKIVQLLAPYRGDHYYRARIVNFTERDAEKACTRLHREHVQCAVVSPGAAQHIAQVAQHRG
jgi:D-alanyl-D-alanine carboxypeptidase